MKVEVYTVSWNEELRMPYFLRHYAPLADRIFVFDNQSDDRTLEILAGCPKVEVTSFDSGGKFDEKTLMDIRTSAWKGTDADWVMVVDVDEFLYHPDLAGLLRSKLSTDISILRARGFHMIHDRLPTTDGQLYDEVRNGVPKLTYDKSLVFRPSLVENMGWCNGCHALDVRTKGKSTYVDKFFLLHFHFLSLEWTVRRHMLVQARMSDGNKIRGLSREYLDPEADAAKRFDDMAKLAKPVLPART